MSLLEHLVPEWLPEETATRALAYILDPHASPGMAQAFVDSLTRTGLSPFTPGKVEPDPSQKRDSHPDLTIRDQAGQARVLVEAAFWKDVDSAQPAAYLRRLPQDPPSGLVFIVPQGRLQGLWGDFKARCNGAGIDLKGEMPTGGSVACGRADSRLLVVVSWTFLLDTLRQAARDVAIEQDIVQLRGLTERMERKGFPPLEESEVADARLAGRLMSYRRLVVKIVDRLVAEKVARLARGGWQSGSYRSGRMLNRRMQVRDTFDMRFGIELRAWRDAGITPLWWVLHGAGGRWQRIQDALDDVRAYDDSLYIPIPLKTGVGEARVIGDAVERMRTVADTLVALTRNERPAVRSGE